MEKKRELLKAHAMETVTHVFNIPVDLTPSNLNCSFIKLQYWLKVNRCGTLLDYSVLGIFTVW